MKHCLLPGRAPYSHHCGACIVPHRLGCIHWQGFTQQHLTPDATKHWNTFTKPAPKRSLLNCQNSRFWMQKGQSSVQFSSICLHVVNMTPILQHVAGSLLIVPVRAGGGAVT